MDEFKRFDKAIEAFERGHKLKTDEMRYVYHLGRGYLMSKDFQKGKVLMVNAVTEHPGLLDEIRNDKIYYGGWEPPDGLFD